MARDPFFYDTLAWRRLRAAAIYRAGGQCQVPGCIEPGVVVDHRGSHGEPGSKARRETC
jgi:hypothetical protein